MDRIRRRWLPFVLWLSLGALACSGHRDTESVQPRAACRLDTRDMEVLHAALEQLVIGKGACTGPGQVLLADRTTSPQFPETVEQARQRRRIEARLEKAEEVTAEELSFDLTTPRGESLHFEDDRVLTATTVDSLYERDGCSLTEVVSVGGQDPVTVETRMLNELFDAGPVKGWKRLQRRYPEMACLVKFSAPGYLEDSNQVVVSYSRMRGPNHGMGGFVLLAWDGDEWIVQWHQGLWVS